MPFETPTIDELVERIESELATRLGLGPILPQGVLRPLARVIAGQTHLLHEHVRWAVDQQLPHTADPTYLEAFGSVFGINRKAATKASGSVTMTGTDGVSIPTGTLLRRVDGEEYEVTTGSTIASGTATVTVTAVVASESSDAVATTELTLVNPVAGIDSSATVATGGLTGGSDQEKDEDLLERILQHLREPPQGGAKADYVAWALEVSEVTRAFALPEHLGAGTVGVTFLTDNEAGGPIPSAAKVTEVQEYIDDGRRPVTASVTVFAPTAVNLDLTFTSITPDTPAVRAAVEASIEDMLIARAEPGGTIRLSWIREAISQAEGETDHALSVPSADVEVEAGEIVVMGTVTWP